MATPLSGTFEWLGDTDRGRSSGMDGLRELLERFRDRNLAAGRLRGLFHVAIGRRITTTTGQLVSAGATWRELAALLKLLRFDKELVAEIGADPDGLAPRDRLRFWYAAIALARPDSSEAITDAEKLIPLLQTLGYVVGPPPTAARPAPAPPAKPTRTKNGKPPPPKKRK